MSTFDILFQDPLLKYRVSPLVPFPCLNCLSDPLGFVLPSLFVYDVLILDRFHLLCVLDSLSLPCVVFTPLPKCLTKEVHPCQELMAHAYNPS
jgi:hypothetical protein